MSSTARTTLSASTVDDVVDAVRQAAADGVALTAARSADGDGRRLDLSALARVVDYPARDMTVTVEAGMTLQTLSQLLANEGQHLPVDMGDPQMTVGAFVASDLAGPRQYGYGTLRDYVIGIEAVDGQGRVFHAGGRVVKNVAGYDLCRLMTGSRGALGILTQLTFKLKPVPEQMLIRTWQFSDQDAVKAALERLNESSARPVLIDLESQESTGWRLLAGVEGPSNVCDWQLQCLEGEIKAADASVNLAEDMPAALEYCQQAAARHVSATTVGVVRTLPSQVVALSQLIRQSGGSVCCHAGNGVILMSGQGEERPADDVINQLRSRLKDHGGHLQLAADGHRFGHTASSYTTGLIDAFDPGHVFG